MRISDWSSDVCSSDLLSGTLRMNEEGVGIAVYAVQGSFDAPILSLTGQPLAQIEGIEFDQLTVTGTMNAKGEIHGDWPTNIGSAGPFTLFPPTGGEQPTAVQKAVPLDRTSGWWVKS